MGMKVGAVVPTAIQAVEGHNAAKQATAVGLSRRAVGMKGRRAPRGGRSGALWGMLRLGGRAGRVRAHGRQHIERMQAAIEEEVELEKLKGSGSSIWRVCCVVWRKDGGKHLARGIKARGSLNDVVVEECLKVPVATNNICQGQPEGFALVRSAFYRQLARPRSDF